MGRRRRDIGDIKDVTYLQASTMTDVISETKLRLERDPSWTGLKPHGRVLELKYGTKIYQNISYDHHYWFICFPNLVARDWKALNGFLLECTFRSVSDDEGLTGGGFPLLI